MTLAAAGMGTRRIATMPFDAAELRRQNDALLELAMHRIADGVGEYLLSHLWYGEASEKRDASLEVRRKAAYLDRQIEATFKSEHIALVRVFAARKGGYIRPHRDFTPPIDPWTRFHIPLQTDEGSLNSEGDIVYHMKVGEVWLFDGSRPHSGINFSKLMRLHLVIDFAPGVAPVELFRDGSRYQPVPLERPVRRPPFTAPHLAAIHQLGDIVTSENYTLLADALGSIHFEKHVSCAAIYDWLIEIGRRSGDPSLVERGLDWKQRYIRPVHGKADRPGEDVACVVAQDNAMLLPP